MIDALCKWILFCLIITFLDLVKKMVVSHILIYGGLFFLQTIKRFAVIISLVVIGMMQTCTC